RATRLMFPYRLGLSATQSSSVSLSPKERIMPHPFLASEFWVLICRHWCNWVATTSRSGVLVRRRAPIQTPTASVHQFAATKILSQPKCVHERPSFFDRHQSFRPVVLDQRQFPPGLFQFLMLLRQRSLRADCILVSSTPAWHAPMPPAPSLADLHLTTAG